MPLSNGKGACKIWNVTVPFHRGETPYMNHLTSRTELLNRRIY